MASIWSHEVGPRRRIPQSERDVGACVSESQDDCSPETAGGSGDERHGPSRSKRGT